MRAKPRRKPTKRNLGERRCPSVIRAAKYSTEVGTTFGSGSGLPDLFPDPFRTPSGPEAPSFDALLDAALSCESCEALKHGPCHETLIKLQAELCWEICPLPSSALRGLCTAFMAPFCTIRTTLQRWEGSGRVGSAYGQ
eukprot:scaffold1307_cov200-Pinguiococcus_pyrenoidosus.AAC.82